MFTNFFFELRQAKIPVTLREYLTLLEALKAGVASYRIDDFYYLSRSCLVKDEELRNYGDSALKLSFSQGPRLRSLI